MKHLPPFPCRKPYPQMMQNAADINLKTEAQNRLTTVMVPATYPSINRR